MDAQQDLEEHFVIQLPFGILEVIHRLVVRVLALVESNLCLIAGLPVVHSVGLPAGFLVVRLAGLLVVHLADHQIVEKMSRIDSAFQVNHQMRVHI